LTVQERIVEAFSEKKKEGEVGQLEHSTDKTPFFFAKEKGRLRFKKKREPGNRAVVSSNLTGPTYFF